MNRHLSDNIDEFFKYVQYWFIENPKRLNIFKNFDKYGQLEGKQWFAETHFFKDMKLKFECNIKDNIIIINICKPFNVTICWPYDKYFNIDSAVLQICREQYVDSPHRYRKCPGDCVVLDFGCSEGIFPGLYCDNTNFVIGFDSDIKYGETYALACNKNCIKNIKFVCQNIDNNWKFDESLLDNRKIGVIKMDIEGNELDGLMKMEEQIIKDKPMLQIATYHYEDQFKEILEYCLNVLGYTNFDFNPNHMLFSLENKFTISENFLKQGILIANF